MTFKRFLNNLILILGVFLTLPVHPVLAQSQTRVFFEPAAIQAGQDGAARAAVMVAGVEGLFGFDLTVSFDPAVLEVVDGDPAAEGVQGVPGSFMDKGFIAVNQADNNLGTLRFAMTQLNPSQPKNGQGTLLEIAFRVKKPGRSRLILKTVQLASLQGEAIEVQTGEGSIGSDQPAMNQPAGEPDTTRPIQPAPGSSSGAAAQPEVSQGDQPAAPQSNQPQGSSQSQPAGGQGALSASAPLQSGVLNQPSQAASGMGQNWLVIAGAGVLVVILAVIWLRSRR